MDDVARQSSAERQVLFTETAARMGASSAVIAEKDFWVCWTLHHLFALEFRPSVAQRALERLDLLEAVARHKDALFHTCWSRYDAARPSSFRLMPSGALLGALRADYPQMQPMFFGPALSFDELVDAMQRLEARINAMR